MTERQNIKRRQDMTERQDMTSNIVAYVGIDNFDIILYLSRILIRLGKKVLLVDHSDTMSLKYSIPQPEGFNTDSEIMHYRNVDFTTALITKEMQALYDDILIAYGFNKFIMDISICNYIVYVTNAYRYNQERFGCIAYDMYIRGELKKALLIRDVSDAAVNSILVASKIDKGLTEEGISVLFKDDRDDKNSLRYHNNRMYKFKDISNEMKIYLRQQTMKLHPEITEGKIKTAQCQAGKGR